MSMVTTPSRLAPTVASLMLLAAALPTRAADDASLQLFDGGDLAGWVVEGTESYDDGGTKRPVWSIEDGIVTCAGKGFGFLRYDRELGDFTLRLEYRMSKGCNSGIGIRGVKFTGPAATRPSFASYEIQIVDDAGKAPSKHGSMSLYRYVAPTANAVRPAGEWNEVEITCRGPRIYIVLNGETVQDVDQTTVPEIAEKPLSGYISLQNHGRRIEFRDVRLTELDSAE